MTATVLRRVLVLVALLFWQGGFTFYASVVVPVSAQVLGSHLDQGLITRHVTRYLNLAGLIALVPLAWDVAASPRTSARWPRWSCWAGMAITLALLAWLHVRLESMFDPVALEVIDRREFRLTHRWYLMVSTAQWACALIYLVLSVWCWSRDDGMTGQGSIPGH